MTYPISGSPGSTCLLKNRSKQIEFLSIFKTTFDGEEDDDDNEDDDDDESEQVN